MAPVRRHWPEFLRPVLRNFVLFFGNLGGGSCAHALGLKYPAQSPMRVDCHLTFSCVPPVSCGAFAAFLSLHGGPPAYMSPDCPTGFKSIGHRIASVPVVEVFWPTYPGSCPSQVILPREPPVFIFYSCVAPYTNPCSPSSPQARPKGPRRQPDTATPQGSPRSGCLTCHLNSGTHQPAFNRYALCVSFFK